MNMSDITKKTDAELREEVAKRREALRSARFQAAGSAIRDVRQIRTDRRTVARILTELNARSRA